MRNGTIYIFRLPTWRKTCSSRNTNKSPNNDKAKSVPAGWPLGDKPPMLASFRWLVGMQGAATAAQRCDLP